MLLARGAQHDTGMRQMLAKRMVHTRLHVEIKELYSRMDIQRIIWVNASNIIRIIFIGILQIIQKQSFVQIQIQIHCVQIQFKFKEWSIISFWVNCSNIIRIIFIRILQIIQLIFKNNSLRIQITITIFKFKFIVFKSNSNSNQFHSNSYTYI